METNLPKLAIWFLLETFCVYVCVSVYIHVQAIITNSDLLHKTRISEDMSAIGLFLMYLKV